VPNHLLVVGICGRNAHEDETGNPVNFRKLRDVELCSLLLPVPEELQPIVSGTACGRLKHKVTGKWHPTGEVSYLHGKQYEFVPLTDEEKSQLTEKYGTYEGLEWQRENWGTKWGTYDTEVIELRGDGSPVMIQFCCAWGPPSPQMMRMIDTYLCREYLLENITWVKHDPYDGSTGLIEVEPISNSEADLCQKTSQ